MNPKANIIRELNRSTRQFDEYMKEYAAREINSPLSDQQWDMAHVIHHVILTDQSVMNILQQTFRKSKKGHYNKYQIRDLLLNRRKKVRNPKQVTPHVTATKSIPQWLKEFTGQRQQLISRVENNTYDLNAENAFPHFQLGLLTRRDWLYLICFHSDRHIAQMQELLFCKST